MRCLEAASPGNITAFKNFAKLIPALLGALMMRASCFVTEGCLIKHLET
jgi:hypothetical protein